MRAPPPPCVAGAVPNGSPRRSASLLPRLIDWLRRGGPPGRDPTSQKGLGGAPEGERLPSNGAVARRVPGLARGGSREAAAHPPRALDRCNPGPLSPPGGAKKPNWACPQENVVSAVGGGGVSSRLRPLSLTRGEARRLTLAGSLCRAPAAIVSVRGMEDPAIPHRHRHDQGLWGIQRKPAAFLGGLRLSASQKGPGMAFPKSDRRSKAVFPSLCFSSKP